jgi:hypothetical protein
MQHGEHDRQDERVHGAQAGGEPPARRESPAPLGLADAAGVRADQRDCGERPADHVRDTRGPAARDQRLDEPAGGEHGTEPRRRAEQRGEPQSHQRGAGGGWSSGGTARRAAATATAASRARGAGPSRRPTAAPSVNAGAAAGTSHASAATCRERQLV